MKIKWYIKVYVMMMVVQLPACTSKKDSVPNQYYNSQNSVITNQGPLTMIDGKAANGILFSLYDNGDTAVHIGYLEGRENGLWLKYYKGKKLQEQRIFKNGWKEGLHKGWYENGRPAFEYYFTNDVFDGVYKEWTKEGLLWRNMNFKNGQEDGLQTLRYTNGKIKSNYVIKNGVRYGLLGTKNCTTVSDSLNSH